jgi:AraC-like DNA-binding protein
MRTIDLEQSVALVSEAFCHHRVAQVGRGRFGTTLEFAHVDSCPTASLAYEAPVHIRAPNPRFLALMHCARGAARTSQRRASVEWRSGQTVPVAAGTETQLWFGEDCRVEAVRLAPERVEQACARWVGHALDAPVTFSLTPFSPSLERAWHDAIASFWAMERMPVRVTPRMREAFEDFLVALLLHNHPNAYSAELSGEPRMLESGLVARADRFMRDAAPDGMSVGEIAASLGVSLRALQSAFRRWRNTTPLAHLRAIKLRMARDALRAGNDATTIGDIAARFGFEHTGRFSAYYQKAFGEAPSVTMKRSRRAKTCS